MVGPDPLGARRVKLDLLRLREREMNAEELREMARMGTSALNAHLFKVRSIANGFLMDYDDVEEYQIDVPEWQPRAPGAPRALPGSPTMKKVTKWKIIRKEVFCADAAAIKVEVDRALELSQKVKTLKAQDVLLGEMGTEVAAIA